MNKSVFSWKIDITNLKVGATMVFINFNTVLLTSSKGSLIGWNSLVFLQSTSPLDTGLRLWRISYGNPTHAPVNFHGGRI